MKYLLIILLTFTAVIAGAPPARSQIGGSVPSPGDCDYPAIGTWGAAGGEYDYACQFPVEENGSQHTTLFGGGMWMVTPSVGVSVTIFNVNLAVQIPAGVLRGISYFACPDFSVAATPNPPGAWKSYLVPRPCKSIAPRPVLIPDGQPMPPPGVPPPPDAPPPVGPYVPPANNLDPTNPNPDTAGH